LVEDSHHEVTKATKIGMLLALKENRDLRVFVINQPSI